MASVPFSRCEISSTTQYRSGRRWFLNLNKKHALQLDFCGKQPKELQALCSGDLDFSACRGIFGQSLEIFEFRESSIGLMST